MTETTPRLIAAEMAHDRIEALSDGQDFRAPQEWDLTFDHLKTAVHELRKGEFNESKKSGHGAIREDFAAEAGFLLGLELGKRLERLKHGGGQ